MQETWILSLGWGDPLEKEMATHSSILACRIPWTVWSIGSQIGTTEQLSLFTRWLLESSLTILFHGRNKYLILSPIQPLYSGDREIRLEE